MYPVKVESNGSLNVYGAHELEEDYSSENVWLKISSDKGKAAIAYENGANI